MAIGNSLQQRSAANSISTNSIGRGVQDRAQANTPFTPNNGNPRGANNMPQNDQWNRDTGAAPMPQDGGYWGGQHPGLGRYRPPTMGGSGNDPSNWNDSGGYRYNLPNAFGAFQGFSQFGTGAPLPYSNQMGTIFGGGGYGQQQLTNAGLGNPNAGGGNRFGSGGGNNMGPQPPQQEYPEGVDPMAAQADPEGYQQWLQGREEWLQQQRRGVEEAGQPPSQGNQYYNMLRQMRGASPHPNTSGGGSFRGANPDYVNQFRAQGGSFNELANRFAGMDQSAPSGAGMTTPDDLYNSARARSQRDAGIRDRLRPPTPMLKPLLEAPMEKPGMGGGSMPGPVVVDRQSPPLPRMGGRTGEFANETRGGLVRRVPGRP